MNFVTRIGTPGCASTETTTAPPSGSAEHRVT
jgi:hypothetical protein